MVNNILVGVDDSPQALAALRWAADLVGRQRAAGHTVTATMLSVWAPPAVDVQGVFDDGALAEAAAEVLDRVADGLADPNLFERAVRQGPTALTILAEASLRAVDLIVVGSRGRSAIAQLLLGSVSRHVAAKSPRPVAIIPESATVPESSEQAPGPTIVAYDDSPGARAALRWALDNCAGELKVITAWSLPQSVVYDPKRLETQVVEEATSRSLLDGLKQVCGGTIDPRISPIVVHDDPRLAILDPALEGSQVVMGSHGHSGFRGLLLGSTVNYVAGHSSQPVIVVPPDVLD